MTLRLPPGVTLNGVEPGELIADSQWSASEGGLVSEGLEPGSDQVPAIFDNGYIVPRTISAQLREDADL